MDPVDPNPLTGSSATGYQNDYQFTGKERDDGTNLLYYEARYYDSALSRFTSLDPWEGDLNDPQSLNQTAYVRNNPLKYVDPSGKTFEDFLVGLFGISTSYAPSANTDTNQPIYENSIHGGLGTATSLVGIGGFTKAGRKAFSSLLAGGGKGTVRGVERVSPFDLNRTHSIGGRGARKNINYQKQQIQNGNASPVEYVEIKGNKYLTDGHHRMQAHRELGQKIPAQKTSVDSVINNPDRGFKSGNDIIQSSAEAGPNKVPSSKSQKPPSK